MHTPWADWELFLAVAERGSFTGAAAALGLTQPTVSRRIVALEEHLGRPLFRRDVDGAHLTAEGERLLASAEQMARWAGELERTAENWTDQPEGVVRITAAPGLAHDVLVPFARNLKQTLPDIRLELFAGIETIDLSRGQAEIAVRTRKPTQPDLMLVASIRVRLGVFVSKSYAARLAARSTPLTAAEIDWVSWSAPLEHLTPRPELEALIPGFRPAFASNDYIVQQRAVAEGLGAMIQPAVRHADEPYAPELVELPTGLTLPTGEMFVVCAKTMRWVPRVQAVLTELLAHFEKVEGVTIERPTP
jgi:DNA-binding transcriptional LysR family regulator